MLIMRAMSTYTKAFFKAQGKLGAEARKTKYTAKELSAIVRKGWRTRRERAALKARGNGA